MSVNMLLASVVLLVSLWTWSDAWANGSAGNSVTDIETIVIVGNHAPPFRIFGRDGVSGLYFDTVQQALGDRFRLEFREMPFVRALYEMEQGRADMMLGPNKTAKREAYMAYTDFHFQPVDKVLLQSVAYDVQLDTREILAGKIIGYLRGATYNSELEKVGAFPVSMSNLLAAGEMLRAGRMDAVIMTLEESHSWLREPDLVQAKYVFTGKKSHVAISRKSQAMHKLADIDRYLQATISRH